MRVYEEQGVSPQVKGVVIESETPQEKLFITALWCNHAKLAAFERKEDSVAITLAANENEVDGIE